MTTALMLMVSVVLWNHLGLCEAVENVTHYKFRILSCSKCGTFWFTFIALLVEGVPIIESVTMSFVAAYVAMWLELLLAIMAGYYESTYDKISEAEADEAQASSSN